MVESQGAGRMGLGVEISEFGVQAVGSARMAHPRSARVPVECRSTRRPPIVSSSVTCVYFSLLSSSVTLTAFASD